jgi:peptide/nickel transport system substrate-binding protein
MTNHPHTAQQATLPRKRRPLVRTTSRERAFSGDATTSTATPRASSTRGPRTTMRRSTVALIPRFIAASAIALLLSAPAAAVNGKPAVDRDTVVFAISSDIGSLDAQVTTTPDQSRYTQALNDTLFGFDAKGRPEPRLASGVKISDDGLRYTFTLRRDVKFHNGAPMTAKDVKYSIERIVNPETKSGRRPYFAPVFESASTPDDHTVVIKLSKPDGAFLNKVAGFLAIYPKEYAESLPSPEAFAQAPVGAGPFKFVGRKIGQSMELARFDDFWGNKAAVKRIVYRVIPEPASRVNALLAGEVDIADGIAASDVARIKQNAGLRVDSVKAGSPLMVRLYSITPGTPLANPKVRQALNYAVDRNAIIKSVLHGIGEPMPTFLSSVYPIGIDPALKPYPYDPAKARRLLAEAGFPNGFDTEIYSSSVMPKEVTEAVVAYWGQVGVRAKIKFIDYVAWARLDNTHGNGPMSITRFPNAIYDPSHPIGGSAVKGGTWSDYNNPEVNTLFAESVNVFDAGERDRIFRKIVQILYDDAHSVPITELYISFAHDSNLKWTQPPGSAYYNLREIGWKP